MLFSEVPGSQGVRCPEFSKFENKSNLPSKNPGGLVIISAQGRLLPSQLQTVGHPPHPSLSIHPSSALIPTRAEPRGLLDCHALFWMVPLSLPRNSYASVEERRDRGAKRCSVRLGVPAAAASLLAGGTP